MGNLLLEEVLLLETSKFKEDTNTGVITLEGVFQKGDTPNANRRVYPMEYLLRETQRLQEACKVRALVGELDHPFYPDENEAAIVHLGNVSHAITSLRAEGNVIYGQMEVINTPSGLILQEFIKRNLQVGVSSRSLGSVTERANGFLYVDNNVKIITWDSVISPSVVESKLKLVEVVKEWTEYQGMILNEKFEASQRNGYDEARDYIRKQLNDIGLKSR